LIVKGQDAQAKTIVNPGIGQNIDKNIKILLKAIELFY